MSDFDLYFGQNCRCGNDPACYRCGAGAAYEAQIEQAQEQAYAEHLEEQMREHHDDIMRGIAAGNMMDDGLDR